MQSTGCLDINGVNFLFYPLIMLFMQNFDIAETSFKTGRLSSRSTLLQKVLIVTV